MTGHGAPGLDTVDCSDLKVAIVAASWHTQVMDGLVAGAERALAAYGVTQHTLVRVPGAFELPWWPTRSPARATTRSSRWAW